MATSLNAVKAFLASIVIWGGAAVGCQKKEATGPAQEVVVQHAQAASIALSEGSGQLLATISDSRCPTNVDCVTAGQATVRAHLRAGSDSSRTVNLCLGECFSGQQYRFNLHDSAAVTLKGQDYWLHLLAVNPYPDASRNDKTPKTATMRLTAR